MHQINITKRELQVLRLVAEEYTNKEIAQHLEISVGSVESHRKNLFNKLSARNMAGLIKRAYDNGLLLVRESFAEANGSNTTIDIN